LAEALAEIKKSGDAGKIARAEQAYHRIMTEIGKGLQVYASVNEAYVAAAKGIFESAKETEQFFKDFVELNRKPGGGT
jgi:hypothetical protein